MEKLSIIICTYNREYLLSKCLESLLIAIQNLDDVEVLVIDNNSIDNTPKLVRSFLEKSDRIKYFYEPSVGLSLARNRGAIEAKGDWLAYIDDDAKVYPDFVSRALWVIENFNFDCFGGMYYAWYPKGKPKWIKNNFGTKVPLRRDLGYVDVPGITGVNFLIKKEVLKDVGYFSTELGMKGDEIGYSEETAVVKALLDNGFKIGFDPELKVDHAVLPHKMEFMWQLKSRIALGRDGEKYQKRHSLLQLYFLLIFTVVVVFIKLPFILLLFLFWPNYYWQNAAIDLLSGFLNRIGQIRGYK